MPDPDEAVTDAAAKPAAASAPLTPAPAAADAPADGAVDWSKTLICVGNHKFPGDKRPIIVVEERDVQVKDGETTVVVKKDGYPAKANLYYRTDDDVVFPAGSTTVTMGVDVQQGMFWGFSPDARWLHVGPCAPAYAACNLAYQKGAKEIEIIGLSDDEKDKLKPWFDKLAEGGPLPVDGATDVRSPAQVKITLS